MSHRTTESVALVPHSTEASNLDNLIPDQLRSNAKNFLDLLKDYYAYLNEDGQVTALSIQSAQIGEGSGKHLPFRDISVSDQTVGIEVTNFTPTGYNQLYKRDKTNPDLYVGVLDSDYIIIKTRSSLPNDQLKGTWIMANTNEVGTEYGKIDFYDTDYDSNPSEGIGSVTLAIEDVNFVGNPSGTLIPSTASTESFRVGKINMVALTNAEIPSGTTNVTFTDMPVYGGAGQGLTVDITVSNARVTSVTANRPGFGYHVGENVRLKDNILKNTVFTVSNLQASPSNIVRRVLGEHDIDKTSDEFLDRIQQEIAIGIPNATLLDRKALYKKIVEYYNTRGSEDSIVSFFKIFFNEIVSVSYPKDQLLIPSDNIYQGTSAVSPTKEKYMYKKESDNRRRIGFYRDQAHLNEKVGTYFVDFEIGDNYIVTSSNPAGNRENAQTYTPLFSAEGAGQKTTNEFAINRYRNAGVAFKVQDNGTLRFLGRFGDFASDISKEFAGYWDTNVAENNKSKKRIRVALTVDVRQLEEYKRAADYDSPATIGLKTYDSPSYHIGPSKLSISTVTNGSTNVFDDVIESFGTGTGTQDTNLYPSALGDVLLSGNVGTDQFGEAYQQNKNGEVYFYGFSFVNRICTDTELDSYAKTGVIPTDSLIDIDLNNGGDTTFVNKNTSKIVGRQIRGNYISETNNTVEETNFGLSSTGSEYPRFIAWLNNKGFLSNINRTHDGDRYQNFSYVVRTALTSNLWKTEFNKLIHPAGLKFFVALYLESRLGITRRSTAGLRFEYDSNLQYLKDIQANNQNEKHSPHFQPGWLEAQLSIPIEIILYKVFSAFYRLEQEQYNSVYDNWFEHDRGLRLRQEDDASLFGNTKKARIDTTNYTDTYIEFEGNGTGLKTGGKIDENSTFQLSFKLLQDNAIGKYVAGSSWTGTDGHTREMSIKQIQNTADGDRQVEVLVTDNAANVSGDINKKIHSIKAVGSQYDREHGGHGVYFSDDTIDIPGGVDKNLRKAGRGHHLIVLNRAADTVLVNNVYDTYGSTEDAAITNVTALTNEINARKNGEYIILYSYDAISINNGLRGALRECGAGDSRTTFSRRRIAHSFIGKKGLNYGEAIENIGYNFASGGTQANRDQAIPISICNYNDDLFSNGDEIVNQPTFHGHPLKVVCPKDEFINLEISANGKVVEHNGETEKVLRSELEASDPRRVKEINYSGYNFAHHVRKQEVGDNSRSTAMYYDKTRDGLIVTGNAVWAFFDNLIKIDEEAEYDISITMKNLTNSRQQVFAGVKSTDENGANVSTDLATSFNYGLASGTILDPNQERTFNATFSGFNPRKEDQFRQTGISGRKFDPGATHFELMFIANYNPFNIDVDKNDSSKGKVGYTENYKPVLLVKNISIKRKDGKAIFDQKADRRDPNYGIKNITTSALPVFDVAGEHGGAFLNTMAIGTLQKNKILEGVTSLEQAKAAHNNNNKLDAFLPWKEGTGAFNINGKTYTRRGSSSENIRELRTDPFGNKTVVWVGRNKDRERFSDGGFQTPYIDIDNSGNGNLYRFSTYVKVFENVDADDISNNARFYYGLTASNGSVELPTYIVGHAEKGTREIFNITNITKSTADTGTIITTTGDLFNIFDNAFRIRGVGGMTEINTASNNPQNVLYGKIINNNSNFNDDQIELYTDAARTIKHDSSSFTDYTSGGEIEVVGRRNPYFYTRGIKNEFGASGKFRGKWLLFVGYAATSNYNSYEYVETRDLESGLFDIETGVRLGGATEYMLDPATTKILARTFNYNNESAAGEPIPENEIEWAYPRIDIVDGNEPSFEDLMSGEAVKDVKNYPSNIQVNEAAISNSTNDFVYLFNEGSSIVGETRDAITTFPDPNDAVKTITLTEDGRAKVLTPTIVDLTGSGNNGDLLSRTGIKNVRRISRYNKSHVQSNNEAKRKTGIYTVRDGDYTVTRAPHNQSTAELGSGAEFRVHVTDRLHQIEVVHQGINFEKDDTITIPNSALSNEAGQNGLEFKVLSTAAGSIEFEESMDDAVGLKPVYITRLNAASDNPEAEQSNGLQINESKTINTTDDFNWQKNVEYEINFDVEKVLDRNTPANLFVGGSEIGYYQYGNMSQYGVSPSLSVGNPNADFGIDQNKGIGPAKIEFNSAFEGLCTIEVYMTDAEGGVFAALNGHELTVKDSGNVTFNFSRQTHIDVDDEGNTIDKNPTEDYKVAGGVYTLVSDKLVKGKNVFQIYRGNRSLDGYAVRWIRVLPAGTNNGLIQTGSNSHNLIFDENANNTRILIDKDATRRVQNNNTNLTSDNIDIKEFHYKLNNMVVRSLRKRVYSSRFEPTVFAPPLIQQAIDNGETIPENVKLFNGTDSFPEGETNKLIFTNQYRPINTYGEKEVDYITGFGYSNDEPNASLGLYIPCLDRYDAASGIGQKYETDVNNVPRPRLGIPEGNFNVLKFVADASSAHGIILGEHELSLPVGTFKSNTYYELTAKVFIPSTNTKLTALYVMAGRNRVVLDKFGNELKNNAGEVVYELPIGEYQEIQRTKKLFGWGLYDLEETKVDTQGTWVDIVHSFKVTDTLKDPKPKILFTTALADQALRDLSAYGGSAKGEFFMVSDIRILEGVNPKGFPFKERTNSKYNALVNTVDNKKINFEGSVLPNKTQVTINTTLDESPTETIYSLRDTHRVFGDFPLSGLKETEPNLLAEHIPFKEGKGYNVATNNPLFRPLGNPYSAFSFSDNDSNSPTPADSDSPGITTFENRVIKDITPFGGRAPIWIAENKDPNRNFASFEVNTTSTVNPLNWERWICIAGTGKLNDPNTRWYKVGPPGQDTSGLKPEIFGHTIGGHLYEQVRWVFRGRDNVSFYSTPTLFQLERQDLLWPWQVVEDTTRAPYSSAWNTTTSLPSSDPYGDFYGISFPVGNSWQYVQGTDHFRNVNPGSTDARADGGFETTPVEINPNDTYRVSCWMYQTDTEFGVDDRPTNIDFQGEPLDPAQNSHPLLDSTYNGGLKRLGIVGFDENDNKIQLNTVDSPSFSSNSPTFFNSYDLGYNTTMSDSPATIQSLGINNNKWYLVVGHIRPVTHTGGTDHPDSGVYPPSRSGKKERNLINSRARRLDDSPLSIQNPSTGRLFDGVSGEFLTGVEDRLAGDWKFDSPVTKIKMFAAHYANADTAMEPVKFFAPRIDKIDGTEPTIQQLTSGEILGENSRFDKNYRVNIASWEDNIHNSRDLKLTEDNFTHTILGDSFNISINDDYKNTKYADYIESNVLNKKGIDDTIITITTPSDNRSITLPIMDDLDSPTFEGDPTVYEKVVLSVDWGDGNTNFYNDINAAGVNHKYDNAGDYTIVLKGKFVRLGNPNEFAEGAFSDEIKNANGRTHFSSASRIGARNFSTDVRTFYLGSAPLKYVERAFATGSSSIVCGLTTFTTSKGTTDTSKVTDFGQMFEGCSNLTTVDVSGLDTSKATTLDRMFKDCGEFTMKGLYEFDLSSLSDGGEKGLRKFLYASKINTRAHEEAIITWSDATGTPNNIRYHMGTSNFTAGRSLAFPEQDSADATPIVENAFKDLDINKQWHIDNSPGGGLINE